MNELENFIVELNSIEKEKPSESTTSKTDKLAEYLFSAQDKGGGWKLLLALYGRKIEINAIFGEKLNDLLLSNFIKLVQSQSKSNVSSGGETPKWDESDLFDSSNVELTEDSGDLFSYLIVCLTLWLRLNDGVHNSQHIFTSSRVLNQLADVLFTSETNHDNKMAFQRIYLKFLSRLFRINFKNMPKRQTQKSDSGKHLIVEQFKRIEKGIQDRDRALLLQIVIDYLNDYFGFVCIPGLLGGASLNTIGFENLTALLNETCTFVFQDLAFVDSRLFVGFCKKLSPILLEMKLFKNGHEHAQNCFRTKHTSQLCRNDLLDIGNRHNDITNISSSECLFKKLDKQMLQLLLKVSKSSTCSARQKSTLTSLIEKFGICSCMNLDNLVETLSGEANSDFYFGHLIAPTVFEYLFMSLEMPTNDPTAANEEHAVVNTSSKRKSIFFPLLVDQSLVSPTGESNSTASNSNTGSAASIEASYNKNLVKRLAEILEALDERSLMLSKYLVHTLKHFTRFIKTNSLSTTNSSMVDSKYTQINSQRSSIKYKWFIYELLYVYKDVLKCLLKQPTSSDAKSEHVKSQHLELACKYLIDFVSLSTSSLLLICSEQDDSSSSTSHHSPPSVVISPRPSLRPSKSTHESISSSSTSLSSRSAIFEVEMRLTRRFLDFLSKQAVKLYEYLCQLCPSTSNCPILLCSELILFKTKHGEQISRILDSGSVAPTTTTTNQSTTPGLEAYLAKCLIETIDKSGDKILFNNYTLVAILLDLYIKCATFRQLLNEYQNFHLYLITCLNRSFGLDENNRHDADEDLFELNEKSAEAAASSQYIEILLDLIFCYFFYNRKKDLSDIYQLMKGQLRSNVNLLVTYLNIMILSKAFQAKMSLQQQESSSSTSKSSNNQEEVDINEADESIDDGTKSRTSSYQNQRESPCNHGKVIRTEYDADAEFSANEDDYYNNEETGETTNYEQQHQTPKYDLILFPKILELCLSFIIGAKKKQYCELTNLNANEDDAAAAFERFARKYACFNKVSQAFLKRLIYLLETCNYNVQLMIYNNYRQHFIDLLAQKPASMLNTAQKSENNLLNAFSSFSEYLKLDSQFTEHCFEILFHTCSRDMSEQFLSQLFANAIESDVTSAMRELSIQLVSRLANDSVKSVVHATCFIRLPYYQGYAQQQEPIEFLLQTGAAPRKWKINLDYGEEIIKAKSESPLETPTCSKSSHKTLVYKDSCHKFYCLRVPIKTIQQAQQQTAANTNSQQVFANSANLQAPVHESVIKHSYSLSFMIRFDDNLVKFSRAYNLNNRLLGSDAPNHSSLESFTHLLSVNLDNEHSTFELWLNQNGNVLFLRRSEQSIVITFNLFQIHSSQWYFVHVNYDEEQLKNKINCKIGHSLNAKEMVEKEFEIFKHPDKKHHSQQQQQQQQQQQHNLYMYVGHQEKRTEPHLFNYDLGQIILSKDASFTTEHLILMMQIMDTNISLVEESSEYEWTYLNGYSAVNLIENISKHFTDYANQIKSRVIAIYNPRNPHICSIKNANRTFNHLDVTFSCKVIQQTAFDTVLAKIGGIEQMLLLLARLVEQENKYFNKQATYTSNSELTIGSIQILEALLNLVNKRPHIQNEFKLFDGYVLLQRIYTSIACLNKYLIQQKTLAAQSSYYSVIQKRLFVTLVNACFRQSAFFISSRFFNNSSERVSEIVNLVVDRLGGANLSSPPPPSSSYSTSSGLYLVNPLLLTQVILEWDLWLPFETLASTTNRSSQENATSNNLWKHIFQIICKLLEDDKSPQLYHTNLFLAHNIHEKLIYFILDANAEHFLIDQASCQTFNNIFIHFCSIFGPNAKPAGLSFINKQLFFNFGDFLYILHPDNNVYIVNQKSEFYFNMNLNLFSSNSDYTVKRPQRPTTVPVLAQPEKSESTGGNNKIDSEDKTQTNKEETPREEKTTTINNIPDEQQIPPSLKAQIMSFDRVNQNELNFGHISTHIMRVMREMLPRLSDLTINDIISLFRFESFIMLAMDENQEKRLEAFKLFIELMERSSTMSFYFTSVASAAGNAVINQMMLAGGNNNAQNWSLNKENLIYEMANQLSRFDELDERFMQYCLTKILCMEFSFKRPIESQILKSQAPYILAKQSYFYLLLSLIYSARKSVGLCRSGLAVLFELVDLEIIRVDYLISRAGLLQVLLNLLKFYSDPVNVKSSGVQDELNLMVSELKNFLFLIGKLLLRLNENQELELFDYFINSLTYICFNSANNAEHEKLNHNIKSIVLSIIQSIMSDFNSITSSQEAPKTFLKKLIMPLISTKTDYSQANVNLGGPVSATAAAASGGNSSSNNSGHGGGSSLMSTGYTALATAYSNAFATNLFDSDIIFQKIIVFVVDFIHIVYDRISDNANLTSTYDINDELAIFSFSVLIHSLSIGLENNAKIRFTSLFRNNLTIIRMQFRRMLVFMMHPNHKLHTRLQLIKRLMNTPNCESILKCTLNFADNTIPSSSSIPFNAKLSIYLNSLTNATTTLSNNDKEILSHLCHILTQCGLNYKNELSNFDNSSNDFVVTAVSTDSPYLMISQAMQPTSAAAAAANRKTSIDLITQIDRDLDEEILKIFYKAKTAFVHFLEQYEKLVNDLSEHSCVLTNQVVMQHSNVRKLYLQGLKNKLIKSYDVKQKWVQIIESMCHEKCGMWHDASTWPSFQILDPTEGSHRERRRLKKSHLYISERFFKAGVRPKLANERNVHPLKYLLNTYEDYLASDKPSFENDPDGSFISNYGLNYWKNNEIINHYQCKNVMPYCEIRGQLLLSETRVNFAADEKNYKYLMGIENVSYSWSYSDIREIHLRRYLLKDIGLEIFLVFGHTILLAFDDTKDRNETYKLITGKKLTNLMRNESVDEITSIWKECKISNYEYIMQLNKFSGRTFNDLMQYPIYPHILSNYNSETLDLANKENYRNLSKPIAIQHKEREEKFLQTYRMLEEASNEPYHYASLYSNSGTVLHYLVRLPPFTKMFLDYQDHNFDVPDRTFHSMHTSWLLSSSESTTDYKELIPEFYFLHEFLCNKQNFEFGLRQNGDAIDNVVLPPWSTQNPRLFVCVLRQALESNYVTQNLNNWIDLIFGYKQSGKAALEAINCYHPACYFGYPVEQISDPVHRKAIETMIKTWGQTPKQLFTSAHPQSSISQLKKSMSTQISMISSSSTSSMSTSSMSNALADITLASSIGSPGSIHRRIMNVKWGSYVGSLDQSLSPVCVWKESCKKNIVSLVSLASNEVIGLSQHKCLLLERAKDSGFRLMGYNDALFLAMVEWNSYDDHINLKTDPDKPVSNLIPIRANENTVICCNCIGSNYVVAGFRSGLIKIFKLKKVKSQIQLSSFVCHLYGHKHEITDIFVCLSYSTMISASQDGLLIIWDTNKFNYVNSIHIANQYISKVAISETTNDIAFIGTTPNKLYFYTGNCEKIGEQHATQSLEASETLSLEENDFSVSSNNSLSDTNHATIKSLCFSNANEGLNVNVIACGLSNGRIRFYSTWDLSILREFAVYYDTNTLVGSIISLVFSRDSRRLYASDTYARVYILEAANSQAAQSKAQQLQLLASINTVNVSSLPFNYSPNFSCFT